MKKICGKIETIISWLKANFSAFPRKADKYVKSLIRQYYVGRRPQNSGSCGCAEVNFTELRRRNGWRSIAGVFCIFFTPGKRSRRERTDFASAKKGIRKVSDLEIINNKENKLVELKFVVDGKNVRIFLGYGAMHQLCIVDFYENYSNSILRDMKTPSLSMP